MPVWPRCSLSMLCQPWSQLSCWPWHLTALWPSATHCGMLLYSQGLWLPKIGLAALARGFVLSSPCLHPEAAIVLPKAHGHTLLLSAPRINMKLSCTDTTVNVVYGLFIILSVIGVDSLLVGFSYVLILRAVLETLLSEAALKAFNTCISHLRCVLVFYLPLIGLSVSAQAGGPTSLLHVIMANIYLCYHLWLTL